jgi:hypothetical protein
MRSFKWAAIVLIALAFFNSCVTQRRCLEKFPPTTTTEIRDSISYRDTTIYVPIPTDTVRDSIPVECPEMTPGSPAPKPKPTKPVMVKNRWSTAMAWIENGHLKLNLMTNDTTLTFVIDSAVTERMKQITINQQFVKPVKYIPKVYKIALIALIIVVFLAVLKILVNLRR